jgi:hypothetical protein
MDAFPCHESVLWFLSPHVTTLLQRHHKHNAITVGGVNIGSRLLYIDGSMVVVEQQIIIAISITQLNNTIP